MLKYLPEREGAEHEVDAIFQALGDPTRRTMVERLSCGPASVSELAQPLAMSLPAVVQHLHVLEHSGLVSSRKQGRVRTCSIEPAKLRSAERWAQERAAEWEQRLDRLQEYLAIQAEPAEGSDQLKEQRRGK